MSAKSVVVIGGGIIGLAIAEKLSSSGISVTLLEKEKVLAAHQTGRNSGVIHAGPYYAPGSLKAELCAEGNSLMVDFARANDVPFEVTGKLLIASRRSQLGQLESLARTAEANGVPSEIIGRDGIKNIEPFAGGIAALYVKNTGIIDYRVVAERLASSSQKNGASLVLDAAVTTIFASAKEITVEHSKGTHTADLLINAAGLHSDRVALMSGISPEVRIIPFKGEYFELTEEARHMVRGLIYPLPNPKLPFLGVHLTKMIDGRVHAGPNAVLAMAREGYGRSDLSWRDLRETLGWPGFHKLALRNVPTGLGEGLRSLSPSLFARSLRELVPGLEGSHLLPSPAGIRAQAVDRSGRLVDDFVIHKKSNQIHLLNAPSPAATAALAIANRLALSI